MSARSNPPWVPDDAFHRIAAAKKVEYKICNDEFTLTKQQQDDLAALVKIYDAEMRWKDVR